MLQKRTSSIARSSHWALLVGSRVSTRRNTTRRKSEGFYEYQLKESKEAKLVDWLLEKSFFTSKTYLCFKNSEVDTVTRDGYKKSEVRFFLNIERRILFFGICVTWHQYQTNSTLYNYYVRVPLSDPNRA